MKSILKQQITKLNIMVHPGSESELVSGIIGICNTIIRKPDSSVVEIGYSIEERKELRILTR